MTIQENKERQEYFDEESSRHMIFQTELRYLIEWLFRENRTRVAGFEKHEVVKMTIYAQIQYLRYVANYQESLRFRNRTMEIDLPFLADIRRFLDEILDYEKGFMTAADFGYSPIPLWYAERFSAGSFREAILNRLQYHGGLTLREIIENFGTCVKTARKHVLKLSEQQKIIISWTDDESIAHLRHQA